MNGRIISEGESEWDPGERRRERVEGGTTGTKDRIEG